LEQIWPIDLLNSVQRWRVTHVKKEANETAHKLAKIALTFIDEQLSIEKTHHYIL
jgi:hypothetical protein